MAASPEHESAAVWAAVRYFLTIFVLFGVLLGISLVTGWDDTLVFTAGGGLAIIVATLKRFDIFWEHPKALWLRGLIGDRWTTLVYVAVGVGFIVWAGYRATGLSVARHDCQALLAHATDSHERVAVLAYRGRPNLPTCESLVTKH